MNKLDARIFAYFHVADVTGDSFDSADIAEQFGITEEAVDRRIHELREQGFFAGWDCARLS